MPRYKELSTKNVWNFVKEWPDLLNYFPTLKENELPDRAFLWGILGTLRTDAWKTLLEDARKARSKREEENKDDLIKVHLEIYEKLMAAPNITEGKTYFYN